MTTHHQRSTTVAEFTSPLGVANASNLCSGVLVLTILHPSGRCYSNNSGKTALKDVPGSIYTEKLSEALFLGRQGGWGNDVKGWAWAFLTRFGVAYGNKNRMVIATFLLRCVERSGFGVEDGVSFVFFCSVEGGVDCGVKEGVSFVFFCGVEDGVGVKDRVGFGISDGVGLVFGGGGK